MIYKTAMRHLSNSPIQPKRDKGKFENIEQNMRDGVRRNETRWATEGERRHSLCKNIPVNDYQVLFPSRASLYCVPIARANLETKDGWKARSDWPSGPWLLSLIGPRDRTHPVMAALSFPGTLCVRACTLQAASTTPCRHDSPTPPPSSTVTLLLGSPATPAARSSRPRYLELYPNIITSCRVQVAVRTCMSVCREQSFTYVPRCPSRGSRAIFSHYVLSPFSLVYDTKRQAW